MNLIIALLLFSSPATQKYKPGEIIIKFKEEARTYLDRVEEKYYGYVLTKKMVKTGIPELDKLNEKLGVKEIERLIKGVITEDAKKSGLDLLYILKFKDKKIDAIKYSKFYEELPIIEYAHPNYLMKIEYDVNDPYFGPDYWTQQWYLFKIKAPQAWDYTQGDSTVVVCPIDNGVDWQHEDIFPNLWVNPGEDLNGNGIFDYPDDLNGIDDDGDGYVDDIIGFDFVSYDWNPHPDDPLADHGTHVFGIAVAATNNGIGIAGVGFKAKGAALRCGDAEYIYTSAAINGIYFAANHGFSTTNHSYGGYSYSASVNQAIQYAVNHGIIPVASAGNDSNSSPHYPSAYENVIGVAATNFDDTKADFSNFGSYVDICAPGVNIVSCVPSNSYMFFDGTSMASPIVAGAVALLRSFHPTWTVAQIDSALLWGADPVDSVNPAYAGQLGRGRLNIYKSIALTVHSYIHTVDYHFDGDGRPEPGEEVNLYLKLTNELHWQDASSITITLTTDDPDLSIVDNTINIPGLSNGDTLEPADHFTIQVNGEIRFSNLYINYSSSPSNFIEAETLGILVGYPRIVIVNDDADNDFVDYYTGTLDNFGTVYEVWNADEGLPEGFLEHDRELVIWLTGNDSTEVLSPTEIDSIISFLNAGGYLMISSQYLAEDPDAQSFIQDYLKASVVETGVPRRVLRSYEGSILGDSIYIRLYGTSGASNCISADHIEALSGADSVLYYTAMNGSGNYGPGAVAYNSGTYKTLYFAFPLEAISGVSNTTTREEFFAAALDWFGVTDIRENPSTLYPTTAKLSIYPTITSSDFTIVLEIERKSLVDIAVYDVTGRVVSSIIRGNLNAGLHKYNVSAEDLKPGVYFIKVKGTSLTPKKLLIVR